MPVLLGICGLQPLDSGGYGYERDYRPWGRRVATNEATPRVDRYPAACVRLA